jgi:hypothetical protein
MPLGISSGGTEAAFDGKAMIQAMTGPAGEYRCAGNFFWLDLSYVPIRNVPIGTQTLKDLQNQIFANEKPVATFPFEIVIAVDAAPATAAEAANLCKHGLKRISPCLRWRGRPAGCIALTPYPLSFESNEPYSPYPTLRFKSVRPLSLKCNPHTPLGNRYSPLTPG